LPKTIEIDALILTERLKSGVDKGVHLRITSSERYKRKCNPTLLSAHVQRDDMLGVEIERVSQVKLHVYGAGKVWGPTVASGNLRGPLWASS
jgi:hypothetical protein